MATSSPSFPSAVPVEDEHVVPPLSTGEASDQPGNELLYRVIVHLSLLGTVPLHFRVSIVTSDHRKMAKLYSSVSATNSEKLRAQ